MDTDDFNYNKYVKKNLIHWRDNFEQKNKVTLNFTAIAKTLENDFNITTSTQKVAEMFNSTSNREIKLQELVAIAQIFDIPLWDLCQYPNTPNGSIYLYSLVKSKKESNNSIHELKNSYYFTEKGQYYYCYYFRPKHFQNHPKPVGDSAIMEAKMSIFLQNGHTVVKLEELNSNTSFYGEQLPSFTLSGNLYLYENTDMAYSFISDSTGKRAMCLMFKYLNLSADIRYYITAGIMTFSQEQTHQPLFEKMAIFRVQQDYKDKDTENTLRGILALNSAPIILDEETLNKLRENESMNILLSEGKSSHIYYAYNEATLRDSYLISDDFQRMQLLLELRRHSLCPAHEIVNEPDSFADFIKKYQLKQLKSLQEKEER